MAGRPGARPLGLGTILDDATTARVRAYVAAVGLYKAARRLRVGDDTMHAASAARGEGSGLPSTVECPPSGDRAGEAAHG